MQAPVGTLSREECFAALASGSVGRVAVTSQALPAIVPVNYQLAGPAIIFRTEVDSMLARACDGNVVAFETDRLGADGRTGWSVLVVGIAALLAGSDALRALELNLASVGGGQRDQFVSISVGRISGRRIGESLLSAEAAGHGTEGGETSLAAYP